MKNWKENICATCLSDDRRLMPLLEIRNILIEINFTALETYSTANICWECKGNIVKFHKFKMKALQAQTALSHNRKLKKIKSLSSFRITEVVNIWQNIYNSDPLINCDNQLKQDNNVSQDEQDNILSDDVQGIEKIEHVYVETINNNKNKKITDDDNITDNNDNFTETVELDDNLNKDDDKVPEIKSANIHNTVILKKNKTYFKRDKLPKALEEKFISIVFSEAEILQNREEKRNHYNFKKVPFKCDSCVLGFTKKETFNQHMEKKHAENIGPHKCDICNVRFATELAVAKHMWRHYRSYKCRLCKYDTTELRFALNHCQRKHKRDHLDKIHCVQCNIVVKTAEDLEEHIQSVHSVHCNICGVRFKGKHTLRNHMARIHANKREYICDICTKTFKNKSRLESHMVRHNSAVARRLSYCHLCHVQYKNLHVYRNHLKNSANHSERSFSCPECKKNFASKVYWTQHYNFYHLHKSQYNCETCNKIFISKWRLKNHQQKHHGLSRPRHHSCNTCGKKFFSISTLRNHKLIHSEERSYMCEDCGDTFKQRPALYNHAKLVHGDGRRKKLHHD